RPRKLGLSESIAVNAALNRAGVGFRHRPQRVRMPSSLRIPSKIGRCGPWRRKPLLGSAYFAITLFIAALLLGPIRPAAAQAVKGEATVTTAGGYGRIAIRLAMPVEAQVRLSSSILVITFEQPVDVPVDRITAGATDYIGAARRDPDGKALRFAL